MSSLFQNFSQAKHYAAFRPTYPKSLYERVAASLQTDPQLCVDVGCGTGQASCALAGFFDRVIGVDPSQSQLQHAVKHPKVSYLNGSSEHLPVVDASVSCITAAQAAHWFDLTKFYKEVDRVLKPGGVLALWTYGRQKFPHHPNLERRIMVDFYETTLGPYWDERRTIVEGLYQELPLISESNFVSERLVDEPRLAIARTLKKDELLGYLRSWSAYAKYCREHNVQEAAAADPVQQISEWMQTQKDLPDQITTYWPTSLLLSVKVKDG